MSSGLPNIAGLGVLGLSIVNPGASGSSDISRLAPLKLSTSLLAMTTDNSPNSILLSSGLA